MKVNIIVLVGYVIFVKDVRQGQVRLINIILLYSYNSTVSSKLSCIGVCVVYACLINDNIETSRKLFLLLFYFLKRLGDTRMKVRACRMPLVGSASELTRLHLQMHLSMRYSHLRQLPQVADSPSELTHLHLPMSSVSSSVKSLSRHFDQHQNR